MEAIETFENAGFMASLYHDENPESPREWDNLGHMVCWHRRTDLGDEQVRPGEHADSLKGFENWLVQERKARVILPIYIYEHSGITITARYEVYLRYPDKQWDAGQVGYIYVTADDIRKEYGVKRISQKLKKKVAELLVCEVSAYDQYLTGDVYGYVVKDETGEHIDSCWGFFGLECARGEAQAALASASNGQKGGGNGNNQP
jgi:hypothetical protein